MMNKTLEIQIPKVLEILNLKKLPYKAIILAGEYTNENTYLKNQLEIIGKIYNKPIIIEKEENPATKIAKTARQMLLEGFSLNISVFLVRLNLFKGNTAKMERLQNNAYWWSFRFRNCKI